MGLGLGTDASTWLPGRGGGRVRHRGLDLVRGRVGAGVRVGVRAGLRVQG